MSPARNPNGEPDALVALRQAVEHGDVSAFQQALSAMDAITWRKRWPESVLGDVLCQHRLGEDAKTEMTRLLLAGRKPPLSRYSVTNDGEGFWSALACAVETKSYGALKLLHGAGFEFHENDREPSLMSMASQIGEGLWPHPDLIAPDLLQLPARVNRLLFERIFTSPNITTSTIDRLATMAIGDETAKRFATALAWLSRPMYEAQAQDLLDSDARVGAVERLEQAGLLDVKTLQSRDNGKALWKALQARFEQLRLEQTTAPAPQTRSGMRL